MGKEIILMAALAVVSGAVGFEYGKSKADYREWEVAQVSAKQRFLVNRPRSEAFEIATTEDAPKHIENSKRDPLGLYKLGDKGPYGIFGEKSRDSQ